MKRKKNLLRGSAGSGQQKNLIVYRGPFQTSRLSLITSACVRAFGGASFVWIAPSEVSNEAVEWADDVLRSQLGVDEWHLVDGSWKAFPSALRSIRGLTGTAETVTAVGFSALPFARRLSSERLTWCVNGIPEERLLYRHGLRDRSATAVSWAVAKGGRSPDLVVTVSKPMSGMIRERLGVDRLVEVPTAVEVNLYHPPQGAKRRYLTYLGSGAPWQGLDQLNAIWREIARRRSDVRFRVASKDERARALGRGMDPEAIEFVRAEDSVSLAGFLHEATLGFVVRSRHIVNRASFPTKIGQYLAAGVPVVSSDMEWDPATLLRGSSAGILIDPDAPADEIATRVLQALDSSTHARKVAERECVALAAKLDRSRWIDFLAQELARSNGRVAEPLTW